MRKRDQFGGGVLLGLLALLGANLWLNNGSNSAEKPEADYPQPQMVAADSSVSEPNVSTASVSTDSDAAPIAASKGGAPLGSVGPVSDLAAEVPSPAEKSNGAADVTRNEQIENVLRGAEQTPAEYLPALTDAELAVAQQQTQQQRFAIERVVPWNSNSHGIREPLQGVDELDIWRMRISSSSASSQNLHLKDLALPEGAELLLSDLSGEFTAGPYTAEDVSQGELWTAIVPGEELVLAVTLPRGSDFNLSVAEVNYGYDAFWEKAGAGSRASACNVDAACAEGQNWQDERSAVSRITLFGRWVCSATLVNNTAEDLRPFMLTAAHCLEVKEEGFKAAESAARSIVAYWDYESSGCSTVADGSLSKSQSGAELRSMWSSDSSNGTDFALVELLRLPPLDAQVFYSGWDARSIAPRDVLGIHHPMGAERSVSVSHAQTAATNRAQGSSTSAGKFLRIGGWNAGVTEQGSSGSGLWNQGHMLVGQLWGGLSSCASPTSPDWYGRLSKSWHGNGTEQGGLKAWLDPGSTNASTLCGVNQFGVASNSCSAIESSNPSTAPSNPGSSQGGGEPQAESGEASGGGGGGSLGVWLLAIFAIGLAIARSYYERKNKLEAE